MSHHLASLRPLGFAILGALSATGCGRSDLLGFDNGCPRWDPHCDQRDGSSGGGDGGGSFGDGFATPGDGTVGADDAFATSGDGFAKGDGFGSSGDGSVGTGDGFGTGDGSIGLGDGSIGVGDGGGGSNRDGMAGGDGGGGGNRDGGGGGNRDGGGHGVDGGNGNGDGGGGSGNRDGGGGGNGDGGGGGVCVPRPFEICNNHVDDDCNGLVDCADPACENDKLCLPPPTCQNIPADCALPDCEGAPGCATPGKEVCNNGIDDNNNGLTDCADPQCFNDPACQPIMGMNCKDGNGNVMCGLVQCAQMFPDVCLHDKCNPDVQFGDIAPHDAKVTRTFDTTQSRDSYLSCAPPGGTGVVGEFTLTGNGPAGVRIDFSQPNGAAHVVSLYKAGLDQACDQNLVYCIQAGQMATAGHSFVLDPGTYRVIVESYPGTQGVTSVTISTGAAKTPEICNNGIDDDGNGLIDCQDPACFNDPNCVNNECKPDINVGTLVVDGPPVAVTFDTHNSENRYHPTCAGNSTGKDEVVEFSLAETAGILVQWTQNGDHVFGLFIAPPAGLACDSFQTSCYYPGGAPGGSVAWAARSPGTYLFIFKPIMAGAEGVMHLSISAYKNRRVEICDNGIDDDNNGLIDCQDPACFGVGNCKAPLCMPDVDLGDFQWGTVKSVDLDIRTGEPLYTTLCAKGGGKQKVVRISIDQVMALGFDCTETGDQVLQLDAQEQPLDLCDADLLTCADPKILPFGCNFAMPNLQPGKYNVIVEGFQAGTEGTVNLTLFGIQEKVLEICNNGIDDDMDGFIDCADKKCVTSPDCTKFACRADQKLGILPLNGLPVSTVVQTSNASDNTPTPCASVPGGKDADIDFELPGTADVTIEWAQVGNHDFALYEDTSDLLACQANPLVQCTPSMNAATGTIPFKKLPKARYHLVVGADKPGSEGGVAIQISGQPSP